MAPPELALRSPDLESAGRRIQAAVAGLPAALNQFDAEGLAAPAEFGNVAQDQQVAASYQALCQTVQELLPKTKDGIDDLGGTVQRWAALFAANDAAAARAIAAAHQRAATQHEHTSGHHHHPSGHHRHAAHHHRHSSHSHD